MSIEKDVKQLVINKMTKAQYEAITPAEDELYLVEDEPASTTNLGPVKVDGVTITAAADGTISADGGVTVVQTTGTSTENVMSQKATTDMVFAPGWASVVIDYNHYAGDINYLKGSDVFIGSRNNNTGGFGYNSVGIGSNLKGNKTNNGFIIIGDEAVSGNSSVAIGYRCSTSESDHSVVVGSNAKAVRTNYSVAVGAESAATTKGEFSIGGGTLGTNGYNKTRYRKITNVYDGENDHDACTKGQLDAAIAGVATNEITNSDWSALWQ